MTRPAVVSVQGQGSTSFVRLETLGCRLNQIESEAIANVFLEAGFCVLDEPVSAGAPGDEKTVLCVVNTCAVTQKAEQKTRRVIRLLLRKYPAAAVLVTGCYAQLSSLQLHSLDERLAVVGGQLKSRVLEVPPLLSETLHKKVSPATLAHRLEELLLARPQEKNGFPERSFSLATASFLSHSRASLKVQDGCDNSCSFCAIHLARGHSVSIDVPTAIARARELEQKGHDEVVITGVNLAQYRSNLDGVAYDFSRLLEALLSATSRIRFRISSLYPELVDDEFCAVISDARVRPHFHMSVQSGSDRILGLMNRVYRADDVARACEKIRAVKEHPFIACDIITGFPGESDEDFARTLDLCGRCDFAWVHAFPFSERPGTPAVRLSPKIPQEVSGQRARLLTESAVARKIRYIGRCVGKEYEAVIETVRRPSVAARDFGQKVYHAVTENFIHCELTTRTDLPVNKAVRIVIDRVQGERIEKGGEIEAKAHFVAID